MTIKTTRSDLIWNYIGTLISMGSSFILLPFLIRFLSSDELGLWYVYLAVANLAMLFEFGFTPTFSRNIVYVVSGAKHLTSTGAVCRSHISGINWHLLNTVIRTSKFIYAIIAVIIFILLASLGTYYISYISYGIDDYLLWPSWFVFCISIFLDLYFLYSITILRGYGDVAGENQAKTISKSCQMIITVVLLFSGFGLLGASIGFFVNSIVLRVYSILRLRQHRELELGRSTDTALVQFNEMLSVFRTIFHLAWRDGIVQLAFFASSQATSILCSLFLSLEQTGVYSIMLQFATAVSNFSAAYPRAFYPSVQSSYAENDVQKEISIISSCIVAFWFLFIFSSIVITSVFLPLIPIFKPSIEINYFLFFVLLLYVALLQQHSIFCNYIISRNEIPYLRGFIVAAILGVLLVVLLCGVFRFGVWGLVLGQVVSQLLYNNWKWPIYLSRKYGLSYCCLLKLGIFYWKNKFSNMIKHI